MAYQGGNHNQNSQQAITKKRKRKNDRGIDGGLKEAHSSHEPQVDSLLMAAQQGDPTWASALAECNDATMRLEVTQELLRRVGEHPVTLEALSWCFDYLAKASQDDANVTIARSALTNMDKPTRSQLLESFRDFITGSEPPHPIERLLVDAIARALPGDGSSFFQERMFEEVIALLAPVAYNPRNFDAFLKVVESGSNFRAARAIVKNLLDCFRSGKAIHDLDPTRAERVARALVSGAVHSDPNLRSTCGHALFRFSHHGAEDFLISALIEYGATNANTPLNDQRQRALQSVVGELYSAVTNLRSPAALQAITERLYSERREYWRLGDAVHKFWSQTYHQQILALLDTRRDAHAAGTYAYAINDFVKKPEPLCQLLRLILRWSLPDEPRQRSFAKYAFLIGTRAALILKDFDLVRQAWLAAEQISEPPIEGDDESRGKVWQSPFKNPKLRQELEDALTGAADKRAQSLRVEAAQARARKAPYLDISDAELALLAKCDVKKRIFHDGRSGELWFLVETGAFLYFDGYDVVSPSIMALVLDWPAWANFLHGVERLDRRYLFWDHDGNDFAEIMLYGDRVVYNIGINNGHMECFGFRCSDSGAAAAFAEALCSGQPESMKRSDPWFLIRKGVIVRTLYTHEDKSQLETVVDGCWQWNETRRYPTQAEGVAAYEQYELESIRDHGALYNTVEWMSNIKHPSHFSIANWMLRAIANNSASDEWLLQLPAKWHRYLTEIGLALKLQSFHVDVGPPASESEIAAFISSYELPQSEKLINLWKRHSTARWQFGDVGCILLSPSEVLQKRDLFLSTINSLQLPADVIMTNLAGSPRVVVKRFARADEDQFASLEKAGQKDLSWCHLSEVIVDTFVRPFVDTMIAALPETQTSSTGVPSDSNTCKYTCVSSR